MADTSQPQTGTTCGPGHSCRTSGCQHVVTPARQPLAASAAFLRALELLGDIEPSASAWSPWPTATVLQPDRPLHLAHFHTRTHVPRGVSSHFLAAFLLLRRRCCCLWHEARPVQPHPCSRDGVCDCRSAVPEQAAGGSGARRRLLARLDRRLPCVPCPVICGGCPASSSEMEHGTCS